MRTWTRTGLVVENSKIGVLQVGSRKAHNGVTTIKSGTVIDKLIISYSDVVLNIEEGAVVKELDYNNVNSSKLTLSIAEGTVLSEVNKN